MLYTLSFDGLRNHLSEEHRALLVAFDPADLLARLEEHAAQCLMIWCAPAPELLGHALYRGMEPDKALSFVQERLSVLLGLHRKHRRRVLLIPADAGHLPEVELEKTAARFFESRIIPVFSVKGETCPVPHTGILRQTLIAPSLLRSQPVLSGLSDELEACLSPIVYDEAALAARAGAALAAIGAFARSDSPRFSSDSVCDETLDAQRETIAAFQSALLACEQELEWYQEMTAGKPDVVRQKKLEHEVIALQHQCDDLKDELAAATKALEWARKDSDEHRSALAQMRSSTSWKVTAPLRTIRGAGGKVKGDAR